MASLNNSSKDPQAKILQARALRTLFVVLIVGGGMFGLRWYFQHSKDTTEAFSGTVNSADQVLAIETEKEGQKVVVFDTTGKKIEQGGEKAGTNDRDPVWRPDGNRIFFVSDRSGKGFQVYRWVPTANQEAEVRSQGSIGKSNPTFPADSSDPKAEMLLVSGGFVNEYDPSEVKGHQILPPVSQVTAAGGSDDEGSGGSGGQFSQLYSQFGDSFRLARWCAANDAIAAVMRSDRGESLIVQPLPKNGEKVPPPIPLASGDRIDFDVSPKDGSIAFIVQNYRWTSASPVPKERRFLHCVGMWKPGTSTPVVIAQGLDDKSSFASPAISPAGDKVLMTVGPFDRASGSMTPTALVTMPLVENAAASAAKLVDGEVYEPSWGPKGDKIAYAKRGANGSRAIYIIGADGAGEHTLSGDTGSYSFPKFSPQGK